MKWADPARPCHHPKRCLDAIGHFLGGLVRERDAMMRRATAAVRFRVLPVPAPARTSTGPLPVPGAEVCRPTKVSALQPPPQMFWTGDLWRQRRTANGSLVSLISGLLKDGCMWRRRSICLAPRGRLAATMTAQLVTDALVMAIWRRGKPDALLHNSSRGSQCTSEQFQRLSQRLTAVLYRAAGRSKKARPRG